MRSMLVSSVCVVVAGSFVAAIGSAAEALEAPVVMPAAALEWVDLDPTGAPGVQFAPVWGEIAQGPFGAFFKLPAGFAAPLHTHTSDKKLVIVSGTYLQAPRDEPEFRMGPGSYLLQPGGAYEHTTSCDESSDCLFYAESEGGFDLHLAAEPPE